MVIIGQRITKYKMGAWNTLVEGYEQHDQCDQIENLFVQYLTINSNEKLPKSIENLPKYGKNDAKY